jgi:long-chain-acyl-CoA dehydrogenase
MAGGHTNTLTGTLHIRDHGGQILFVEFCDWAIKKHLAGELTTAEASAAKLWHTDLQWELCDASLQLHGGAGYMNEYAIARLWRDARVTRIFGGTNEIMKEVISRSI